jgi:hypothetical protein
VITLGQATTIKEFSMTAPAFELSYLPVGSGPVIRELDPNRGNASGGEEVTIRGHYLAGVYEVHFGGKVLTGNDITVDQKNGYFVKVNRTPPGTAGSSVPVYVVSRDSGGHSTPSNTLWYQYDTPAQ